jgi:hypothetical protein
VNWCVLGMFLVLKVWFFELFVWSGFDSVPGLYIANMVY